MSRDGVYEGGYRTYGGFLGVLMLDTTTPRPPGDCGNARTYGYPVQFRTVEGASAREVVTADDPEEILGPFVAAAEDLVEQGAAGIVTGCGYLLRIQEHLSERVDEVPVFTSPLLQIPIAESVIAPDEKIGVIVSNEESLWSLDHPVITDYRDRLTVEGLGDREYFNAVFIDQTENTLDLDVMEEELLATIEAMQAEEDVGTVLFECTNLHPYAEAVQRELDLPVFDQLTLADMAWQTVRARRY
ncbi:aspartate/glutamate racemase family protein [Halorussus salinisoli]|uniref:hypothetical protein n=1 Tax=Halorussus salinisoli TaxID=2558242 RepID=UPI0010C18EEE|nr:hypothetical protein [Halorussus salinisoli]